MNKTIKEIKEEFKNEKLKNLDDLFNKYNNDERKGVINLIKRYEKKIKKHKKELKRLEEISQYEKKYYKQGYKVIAGIDEVGRGPLAGPVVTAVVVLPKDFKAIGINDSKKLTEKRRNELYKIIKENAIEIQIGMIDNKEIDDINILNATYKAMQKAISKLKNRPDIVLVDAVKIPDINIEQLPIIKGDSKSISIAAASIIAKVTRDKMMVEYSKKYPQYDFQSNKGYGSKTHIEAIKNHSYCALHRKSFIKNFI